MEVVPPPSLRVLSKPGVLLPLVMGIVPPVDDAGSDAFRVLLPLLMGVVPPSPKNERQRVSGVATPPNGSSSTRSPHRNMERVGVATPPNGSSSTETGRGPFFTEVLLHLVMGVVPPSVVDLSEKEVVLLPLVMGVVPPHRH